jgi:hypothetical protein
MGPLAVVASLLLTWPLGAASRLAVAPVDLIDVRVNQTTAADQHEPSLAVDPTNPNNVLVAAKDWRTGPKQVWHYRSTDGGSTWTDGYANLLPSELPNQSDPVIAFGATGAAYMSLLGYNQSDFSVGGVFVARTDDAGLTWHSAVELSANSKGIFNDKEWLTVDRSANPLTQGNVYVTWTLFTRVSPTRERSEIVISRSTDGGNTFSARRAISPQAHDAVQGSYSVVDPNGKVHVLYFNSPGQSLDEQKEEERGEQEAGGGVVDQAMQAPGDGDDTLYLVTSTDGGQTFGPPARVARVTRPPGHFPGADFRIFVLPTLAVDPASGALYATWNDYGAGNTDAMLATSTDSGSTWSPPARLNDDPPSSGAEQFFPTAIVGRDGILHAMWLDTRDGPQRDLYRPYYTRSTDSGRTFAANAPLSTQLSDPSVGFEGTLLGDYVALDLSKDGTRLYAAWVDTRNGDQDIYFTTLSTQSQPLRQPLATVLPHGTPIEVPSPQPLTGFNNRAFITNWERADRAVVTGQAQRPWVWGPTSFAAASEPYRQGQGGTREVLYFDKARMEINNPSLDPASAGYVTNGLLVVELMSGRVQIGNAEFEPPRPPADIPLAGDISRPDAITYASLSRVASLNGDNRAPDRTGQGVAETLNRAGQIARDASKTGAVRLVTYEPILGHNIPDVFWNFMNADGPIYNGRFDTYSDGKIVDWLSAFGYPITEPYWTTVNIGGHAESVLVQAFQRRVLTYVADNPPGWQVEMGNTGRHYFDWRYGRR